MSVTPFGKLFKSFLNRLPKLDYGSDEMSEKRYGNDWGSGAYEKFVPS